VARRCGARRRHRDRLVAAYARFAWPGGAPADLHTLVEAAADGWWYAARVPDGGAVASWMSDSDLVHRTGLHREAAWSARLAATRHIRELLAGAERTSGIAVRAAATHCLDRTAGDGWLAVGDAACAFDPLASAGIVTALRTGLEAAAALARHREGDGEALTGYDAAVQARFAAYRTGHAEQYAREARWPAAPFWRRRRWGSAHTR
jgi:flavin-dependent dehydrogenase